MRDTRTLAWVFLFVGLVSALAVVFAAWITNTKNVQLSAVPSLALTQPETQTNSLLLPTPQGKLVFDENFEDGVVNDLRLLYGNFEIAQTSDGNHVWRTVNDGFSQILLPPGSDNYAVQARVMQVAGDKGFGMIHVRGKYGEPCPSYQTYMDVSGGWLNLVEKAPSSCDELRETGLFANTQLKFTNGVWYTVRVEAKGAEVSVYWDGTLALHDRDIDGNVLHDNNIGISACCGDLLPHTFDFDDIKVWLINP